MTHKNRPSTRSETAMGAQHNEARIRIAVGRSEEALMKDGFEIPELMRNRDGNALERVMLWPGDKKMPNLSEEEIGEIAASKVTPREAIEYALRTNPLASRYHQWQLYAPHWLQDLDRFMQDYMAIHPAFAHAKGLSPDSLRRIVKPVVAGGGPADIKYGTDVFFVFHDPDAFETERAKGLFARERDEAQYLNFDRDTIVTVDVCADIDSKLATLERKGHVLRADVLASKIEMMANEDRLQTMLPGGIGQRYWEKSYTQRMQRLAKLIVDTALVKKQEHMHHFRSPERERAKREQDVAEQLETGRTETKRSTQEIMQGKQAEAQKRKVKEDRRRQEADEAKRKKDERAKANKDLKKRK